MKELVLTGIHGIWPEDENSAIFLGPWCFAGHPKYAFWDQAQFELAPSPWKSKRDILLTSAYLDSLVERIVPVLAEYLNDWYGSDYSERFWRLNLICWLVHWLGIVYDRFKRLEYLEQAYPGQKFFVRVIGADAQNRRFANYQEFSGQFSDHNINLCFFSQIVHLAQFKFLEKVIIADSWSPSSTGAGNFQLNHREPLGKRLRGFLKARVVEGLSSCAGIRLGQIHGLSGRDRFFLLSSVLIRSHENRVHRIAALGNTEGHKQRLPDEVIYFETRNLFEEVISRMVLGHVPENVLSLSNGQHVRKRMAKVWIGNDIWNPQMTLELASLTEAGGKWISVQHGGGYGQNSSFPIGKIEYEVADGFISWGWNKPHLYDCCIYPLPSPFLSKLPCYKNRTDKLIYVGREALPYRYRLHSLLSPEELFPYLLNQRDFLQNLDPMIRSSVQYRAYRNSYGVDEKRWIMRLLGQNQMLDDGRLLDHMARARLVVIDHLGTSLLESLAMGAPTICFWNPEHFRECEEARTYFDYLRDAEILYDSPEAAATKVNEIWDGVHSWWHSEAVQTARIQFCRQYALTSKNWLREWATFLRSFLGSEAA